MKFKISLLVAFCNAFLQFLKFEEGFRYLGAKGRRIQMSNSIDHIEKMII